MNVSIIRIDEKTFLDWLQFQGGKLIGIRQGDYLKTVELIIEHPDLPFVYDNCLIPTITPVYTKECAEDGNVVSLVRVDPPRKN